VWISLTSAPTNEDPKVNFNLTLLIGRSILLVLIAVICVPITQVQALSPAVGKTVGTFLLKESKFLDVALPEAKVVSLAAKAEKSGGTKVVGNELAALNLPNEVIEDTFARILVHQGRVATSEAQGWMRRLSGVDGFRAAMRKSMGASPANTIGHLNEVRIADNAALGNLKVHGIGVQFKDPNKGGMTDIDVLLEKRGQFIAIEAKDYPSHALIPLDSFRADMLTLSEYRRANPEKQVLAVFSITNKPDRPEIMQLLQSAADLHQVELVVGSPQDLLYQLPLLLK
jgi:hypothetical protein